MAASRREGVVGLCSGCELDPKQKDPLVTSSPPRAGLLRCEGHPSLPGPGRLGGVTGQPHPCCGAEPASRPGWWPPRWSWGAAPWGCCLGAERVPSTPPGWGRRSGRRALSVWSARSGRRGPRVSRRSGLLVLALRAPMPWPRGRRGPRHGRPAGPPAPGLHGLRESPPAENSESGPGPEGTQARPQPSCVAWPRPCGSLGGAPVARPAAVTRSGPGQLRPGAAGPRGRGAGRRPESGPGRGGRFRSRAPPPRAIGWRR